jgi:hypothetical protein
MEREEIYSLQVENSLLQHDLREMMTVENRRELQRYRYELIQAGAEQEKLKAEARFLQTQLVLAAEKIIALTAGQPAYWDDPQCV